MRIQIMAAGIAWLGLLATEGVVQAQRTSTGTSGMFGSRTLGGNISAGNRTFGGSSGTTGNLTTSAQSNVGQVDTSARFMRNQRQAGEFVGAGTEELANAFIGAVQSGQNTSGQRQAASSIRGPSRATGVNTGGGTARRTRGDVSTSLNVGFTYPPSRSTAIGTTLAQRFQRVERIQTLSPVSVEMEGSTATLRGTVGSNHDRDLCEQLARLEPGIWDVRNELVVAVSPVGEDPARSPEAAEEEPVEAPVPRSLPEG